MRKNSLPAISISVLIVCFLLSVGIGGDGHGLSEFFKALFASDQDSLLNAIIWQIRMPRTLAAMMVGIMLASAGVMTQGLFQNPLAAPSVIGINSGSTAMVAITYFSGWAFLHWSVVPLAALLGGAFSTGLLIFIAGRMAFFSIEKLLLVGFTLSALFGALSTLFVSLSMAQKSEASGLFFWLMGSFNAKGWEQVMMLIPFVVVGLFLSLKVCYRLNVLMLGEDVAKTLGISPNTLKRQTILVVAILVGGSVAVSGGISFVGFIVPHITRMIYGPEHKKLLVFSAIHGGSLLLICDLLARTVMAPQELQVGVLTAALGAILFIGLLSSHNKGL